MPWKRYFHGMENAGKNAPEYSGAVRPWGRRGPRQGKALGQIVAQPDGAAPGGADVAGGHEKQQPAHGPVAVAEGADQGKCQPAQPDGGTEDARGLAQRCETGPADVAPGQVFGAADADHSVGPAAHFLQHDGGQIRHMDGCAEGAAVAEDIEGAFGGILQHLGDVGKESAGAEDHPGDAAGLQNLLETELGIHERGMAAAHLGAGGGNEAELRDAAAPGLVQQVHVALVIDDFVRQPAAQTGDADAGNDLFDSLADAGELVGLCDVGLDDAQPGMFDDAQLAFAQHQGGDAVAAGEGLADKLAAEKAAGAGDEEVHSAYSMTHSLAGREIVTILGEVPSLPSCSARTPRQVMR